MEINCSFNASLHFKNLFFRFFLAAPRCKEMQRKKCGENECAAEKQYVESFWLYPIGAVVLKNYWNNCGNFQNV